MNPHIFLEYEELQHYMRKGMRTGNWQRMNILEKAFYRAAIWYAKHQRIINRMLVEKLLGIIEKLKETKGMRIFKRGFERAAEMLEKGEENFRGVFVWAPRLKNWLKDPDYVFWLGTVRR